MILHIKASTVIKKEETFGSDVHVHVLNTTADHVHSPMAPILHITVVLASQSMPVLDILTVFTLIFWSNLYTCRLLDVCPG